MDGLLTAQQKGAGYEISMIEGKKVDDILNKIQDINDRQDKDDIIKLVAQLKEVFQILNLRRKEMSDLLNNCSMEQIQYYTKSQIDKYLRLFQKVFPLGYYNYYLHKIKHVPVMVKALWQVQLTLFDVSQEGVERANIFYNQLATKVRRSIPKSTGTVNSSSGFFINFVERHLIQEKYTSNANPS
jgi:hypothetical protein